MLGNFPDAMREFMVDVRTYEKPFITFSGRLLRLGLLGFALVLNASYTANLAAFFSAPSYTIYGPSTYEELAQMKACIIQWWEVRPQSAREAQHTRERRRHLIATHPRGRCRLCFRLWAAT